MYWYRITTALSYYILVKHLCFALPDMAKHYYVWVSTFWQTASDLLWKYTLCLNYLSLSTWWKFFLRRFIEISIYEYVKNVHWHLCLCMFFANLLNFISTYCSFSSRRRICKCHKKFYNKNFILCEKHTFKPRTIIQNPKN